MVARGEDRGAVAGPVLLVDSYAHGISIGRAERCEAGCLLELPGGTSAALPLRSRYVMRNGDPCNDLRRHLERLSARGELRNATVVFGVTTDPFHPFDEKFAASMKLLQLFEHFVPGRLIIQTRSPLVVIALPALQRVRPATFVAIGIETPLDDVRRRYTPELPSVEERWKTVRTLKRFGFTVGVQVAPILPYGEWRAEAHIFADELAQVADFISVSSVLDSQRNARQRSPLARALAADRQFFWLRHDAHRPLQQALQELAPEKLFHPLSLAPVERQMHLFA